MRPRLDVRPGRPTAGQAPGTDPLCLLITTAAVVISLLALGLPGGLLRPASARPGPRGTVTRPGRAASGLTALAGPTGPAALRLLARAAAASGALRYQGMEVLTWRSTAGTLATMANVWHGPGQQQTLLTAALPGDWPYGTGPAALAAPARRTMASLLALSPRQVSLLGANYAVALAGQATVADRPAQVVAVRSAGGRLAARFWLDRATGLPLRREMFDTGGRLLSEGEFVSLKVGRATGPAPAAEPGSLARVWRDELAAGQLARLRARGWPLPGPLPGHLALLDARETTGPGGPVVHLAYSDGLALVSVFVQPGTLPVHPPGWSPVSVAGHRVYADDPDDSSIAWSAHGFVFTVIAQAPPPTVSRVVAALPHDTARPAGLLARMRTGARRLLAWLGLPR
jgi:sigma-E factor negative regulatory protein RseB